MKNINNDKIKKLYLEYKEVVRYIIFGILTTVINFLLYFIFTRVFEITEVISSLLAWFGSVLFAYITNKLFVFENKANRNFIVEISLFFLARVGSGILCDVGTFAIMVNILHINDVLSKIVTQVMVVIVNYLFSKLIIFKK